MKIKQTKKILFLILALYGGLMYSQTVTGKVLDDDLPIPGVNVVEKGTRNGVVTDFDGGYTINNLEENAVLVFSYIGYATKEVTVNSQSKINVTLSQNTALLDEVVVVGYGTQKKSTLTTSISTVKAEQLSEIPVADIAQALQGRAAGVNITNSGSPGGKTLIRIRGLSTFGDGDPLFVLDGVFTNDINSINPASIAKVDVLKDAAATAIYGSRGSNGVVIITTKKGSIGKINFKFNTYSGFQQSNKRYDLMNTEQYVQFLREIAVQPTNGGTAGVILDPNFNGNGVDTDWQDELFQTGLMTNYDFNASGGSDKGRFSFGFSAFDQDGIYIDTNFKRYTFNINSEAKVLKNFKVGQNLSLGYSKRIGNESAGGREPLYSVISIAPYISADQDENGQFAGTDVQDFNNASNYVRITNTKDNLNRFTSLTGSLYAEIEPFKGLTFKTQYGINANYNFQDNISRAFQETGRDFEEDTNINKNRSDFSSTVFTNTLNYAASIGKSNLNVTLVSENQESRFSSVRTSSTTKLTSELEEISNGISNSITEPDKLVSYLGRINYDFDSKYLLQLSLRRDKSSRFPKANEVGWFPAASVGWVASKESFFNNTAVNNLKFKASYGVTGNNKAGFLSFIPGIGRTFFYPTGGETVGNQDGVFIDGANNPDLKWEEAIKQNVGFELGLWNNKLTFEADYFINESEGLLVPETQAPSPGIPSGFIFKNVGDVEVKGLELTLGINDYEGDFQWSLWANVTTTKSNVNSLGNTDQLLLSSFIPFSENLTRLAPDLPLYHFFGYQFEGVYATDQEVIDHIGADNLEGSSAENANKFSGGDARYTDINGDNEINALDRVLIGDPNPDFTYSVNLSAKYKGFDASALITGVQGGDVLNANKWYLQSQEFVTNFGTEVLRRWQNPGDITDVPRFKLVGDNLNNKISTRYIEDGSYARLKNVSLGYSLSKRILNNTFSGALSKIRLYVQSQNLVTLTKYSGLDPEIEPSYGRAGTIVGLNIDRGRAPQPKTFIMGLQIEF